MMHKLDNVLNGNMGGGYVFRNEEKHAVMQDNLLCVSCYCCFYFLLLHARNKKIVMMTTIFFLLPSLLQLIHAVSANVTLFSSFNISVFGTLRS